ncbi:ABC transporter permease [Paenibacillus sp. J5C_2022]|uniref:ABC transporter permease n=1 Tax=Paenibacillus sp. J5C2022 TaxID=2977129 RepID=UPI0021D105F2|nr:ABC transporter permease [Paenibacillus sp. J5C2022]MCU6712967.1 ABC transporter permease [Paenibacillus sp. J5C2022]
MNGTKQFSSMFAAQLKMMFREKQVWFWNLFFPIILMILFMIIFGGGGGNDSFKATIATVDPAPNASSGMLLEALGDIPALEWKEEQPIDLEQGQEWVKNDEIDALIVLPASEAGGEIQLIVNREDEQSVTTQAISGILDRFVQGANMAAVGAQPIFTLSMDSVTSASQDITYKDFLLTGMIGLAIAQGGLFGMVDLVDMRKRGLLKRLRMTPASMGLFGLAGMLVRLMLGIIQIVILAIVGVFGFGAHLDINVFSLAVAFFAGALVFNAMGYLFSSFSKTMEAYMGVANIASMLMMFLSGVFFPMESLPEWLQVVPKLLPLTYFVEGMRDGLIYGTGIASGEFWMGMGIMALWGVVSFLLAMQLYKSKSIAATR